LELDVEIVMGELFVARTLIFSGSQKLFESSMKFETSTVRRPPLTKAFSKEFQGLLEMASSEESINPSFRLPNEYLTRSSSS
jgi:hypothetical protein